MPEMLVNILIVNLAILHKYRIKGFAKNILGLDNTN